MSDDFGRRTFDGLFKKMKYALEKGAYELDNSMLSSLIHSLPLNVYAKDTQGRFIFANSFYCKSVGKPSAEILGKTDYDIHPGELADKYRADDEKIMHSRQSETIEEKWQLIGGEYGYVQVIKTPLFDNVDREQVIGTIGIFWDITERKKTEIELAEERNLLRTVIDNLPDYIYVKDRKSRFVLANKAIALNMGGNQPNDLIGKTDFDYYSPVDAEKFFQDEQQIITKERPLIDIEEFYHAHDGSEYWLLTSKLPLRNIEGEVIGLVGMGHDITERKRAEQERKRLEAQLLHSQKMETVGTLTAGIAHDFNNLLNVINGYSELLLLGIKEDDPHHKTINKILRAGHSAAELVSQLMAFSRKQVVQPRIIDFNELLTKTQKMLRRIIGEKIDIRLNLAPDLWHIEIDPAQMEQVIVNLAANARDAMSDGGLLRLETSNVAIDQNSAGRLQGIDPGDYIRFTVSDNGCGIEKDIQAHIFDPFFTTKEKHKGTGLGLASVFGVIQQNSGAIELESDQEPGATFQVYLPGTSGAVSDSEVPESELDVSIGTETILVVEDEQDILDLVSTALSGRGYRVQSARGGFEALKLVDDLGDEPIDLLLTDVVMPEMSGRELADHLLSDRPALKVLFMSGYSDDSISRYDLAQPGMAFIQKPVGPAVLAGKVRQLLDS